MGKNVTRLAAVPIITCDPYFSIWSAADLPTDRSTTHWAGSDKPLTAGATIDGVKYRLIGIGNTKAMTLVSSEITATKTEFIYNEGGVEVTMSFTTPLLCDDLDVLSSSIAYGEIRAVSIDGRAHSVSLSFSASAMLTYPGEENRPMIFDEFETSGLNMAYVGQKRQKPLSHTGDHLVIDWGYLFIASEGAVSADERGVYISGSDNIRFMLGYDDVASINYFGRIMSAWYARNGKTFTQMMAEMGQRRGEILARCNELDRTINERAVKIGGRDYALVLSAAYRQCIAGHKLIADENGEAVFLSKENDSNGCIGTVDVSYPSIPLMLLFNPELVRAMCRPILKFAEMPVWTYDFAPHDAGRYPYATGQVYALKARRSVMTGDMFPPLYLYGSSKDMFDFRNQMPVEECGNMLLMLAAAWYADGDIALAQAHADTLGKWVKYLIEYGEDPGEQLCTDDFAGHMARNINLSAKAVCGVAAYGMLLNAMGDGETGKEYLEEAKAMAAGWLERADAGDHTALTFDGIGWSMKYNMVWDKLFGLGLLPESFYLKEAEHYAKMMNAYGLPLDSRSDYTKTDWEMWIAAMTGETGKYASILVNYQRDTASRVAFSDWYDTKTGNYHHFIARTVIGGVFMPMLFDEWENRHAH